MRRSTAATTWLLAPHRPPLLSYLAEHVENMIVASADLSNSDKTDGFLKKDACDGQRRLYRPFPATGRSRVHDGLHHERHGAARRRNSGLRNVLRILGLYESRAAYRRAAYACRSNTSGRTTRSVWARTVPTHQPIEHEAQLRLMEQLRNHKGERSVVVLRPADSDETVAAWKIAMENERPTALILSRQNIKNLPAASGDRAKGSHAGRQGRLYRRRLRRNPGRNLAGERFGSGYADRRRRKAESRRRESTRSIGSVRRTIPRPEQGSTRRACCRAACRSSV